MKNIIFTLLFTALPFTAVLAEELQYNYIEASIIKIDIDSPFGNVSYKGYGFDVKKSLNEAVFISGIYQTYGNSDVDTDRILIGAGLKHAINQFITPFGQIDFVTVKSETTMNVTLKQRRYSAGLSGYINNFRYKIGLSRYEVKDNSVADETVQFAELNYLFDNTLTVGLEIEVADYANIYSLTGRYNF